MQEAAQAYPKAIKPYVDWFLVEALGAVNKYPSDKAAAGEEARALAGDAGRRSRRPRQQAALIAKAVAEKEAAEKAAFAKKHFVVMPGVAVKKIKMPREVAA